MEEIEEYGDPRIRSKNAKVSVWLKLLYIACPIWGIIWFFLYWNGMSGGFLDRGYWGQLEEAANTKFPNKNYMADEKNASHNPSKS